MNVHLTSMRLRAGCLAALLSVCAAAWADGGDDLRKGHESRRDALAASPFKRPLVLESSASATDPHGDVYAVVDHPFATVAAALRTADHWCDVFMVQSNIKRCVSSGKSPDQTLTVSVVRKLDQSVADANELAFRFSSKTGDERFLSVRLTADTGPVGTRDYKLVLEAIPLDAGRTFIHMSYAYASGVAARLATNAYLASAGRDKVGFTITGKDDSGAPRYVDGIQGVAERNVMRYFLAIEALLKSINVPADAQADTRLREWFASIERYPRQLHELTQQEYLTMKRRELADQ